VPPLHVFLLGDNRGSSRDSRAFGPVSVDQVVGRAWLVYWPLDQIKSLY
jgi:signal peptidase I